MKSSNGTSLLKNPSVKELSLDELANINGGNSWYSAGSVYLASFGLLALGGPVTIAAGAAAHVAGIWMLGDMGRESFN